jgi:hypothetical protein
MNPLAIIWLVLLTILATIHVNFSFTYPIPRIIISILIVGGTVCAAALVSTPFVLSLLSCIALIFGLNGYFLKQRFASRGYKIGFAKTAPWFLRLTLCFCFASGTISLARFFNWYFGFIPLILWAGLGYLSVEIAITRLFRSMQFDRQTAIRSINAAQNRMQFGSASTRHPFP